MKHFTITLPETPDRTEKAKAHFKERGVVTEFFDGINAEVAGLSTEHTYEIDNPGTNFRMGYKPTGIWLSHWMLWKAFTLLPDQHFMVTEIDVQFPVDWHIRTEHAIKDVPADFDMLFLGSCCCKGRPQKHIKGEVWEVKWPACNHCYIIAQKALPLMLSMRKIYGPIDLQPMIDGVYAKMKVYTVLPTIMTQFNTETPP